MKKIKINHDTTEYKVPIVSEYITMAEYMENPIIEDSDQVRIQKRVQREDEIRHARTYHQVTIPQMVYPSGKEMTPTSIRALVSQIKGCLP